MFRRLDGNAKEWLVAKGATATLSPTMQGVQLVDDGRIVAVGAFDHWLTNSAYFFIAVGNTLKAYRSGFLNECFNYYFNSCGRDTLLCNISDNNWLSREGALKLGFEPLAEVPNACGEGENLHIMKLTADKWRLNKHNRKAS